MQIIFVDEINSSTGNGIGTYKSMILSGLRCHPEIKIALLGLNAPVQKVTYNRDSNYTELLFPPIINGNWNDGGFAICAITRNYIADDKYTIFMLNHSPCDKFILYLKDVYVYAKVVCVIHDQGWCSTLFGSKSLLRDIIMDIPNNSITDDIRRGVKEYCEKEKSAYKNADAIVCLSKSTISVVKDLYGIEQNRIVLIPNIYRRISSKSETKSSLRHMYRINPADKIIVYAGRLAQYKGIPSLLVAMAELEKMSIPVKLVVCGAMAGLPRYEHLISPIATSIIFTGQLSADDLNRWYIMADIGILPSYSEQFGYVAMEMIDHGLLLVVSDGNGLSDLFSDGETALVAHIESVVDIEGYGKALALKIKQALSLSDSQRAKIIENGTKLIEREFCTKNIISKYMALFNRLVL